MKHNFWPAVEFHDGADLNRQAHAWMESVANVRVHGTTGERPLDRFAREVPHLQPLPGPERVEPFLREERRVGRDGFVAWERGWYGVPWTWAGQRVHVASTESTVELWPAASGSPCTHARRVLGSVWCCPGNGPGCRVPMRAARRPKPAKLAVNAKLRRYVQERLAGVVVAPSGAPVRRPVVPWTGRRHGRGQKVVVYDGEDHLVALVGDLDSPRLASQTARFVREVRQDQRVGRSAKDALANDRPK